MREAQHIGVSQKYNCCEASAPKTVQPGVSPFEEPHMREYYLRLDFASLSGYTTVSLVIYRMFITEDNAGDCLRMTPG